MAPNPTPVEVFGVDSGRPILEQHFDDVRWDAFADELRCTEADDVMAYLCSTPPAESAPDTLLAELRRRVDAAFAAADGMLVISKDTGAFVCTAPRNS